MRIDELIEELIQIKKDYGNLWIIPADFSIMIENDLIVF